MNVAVLGTGLVGGSLGLALRRRGHSVVGYDAMPDRAARALELGAIDHCASTLDAAVAEVDVAFVATPVGAIAPLAARALALGAPIVSDVGSVKGPIIADVEARAGRDAARFIGGHPMAGSEQEGVEGADVDLFVGATWVFTPTDATDPAVFTTMRSLAADLGADVVAVTPEHHDELVAFVSHVPQLAATTLMDVADAHTEEHRALLRLAAGGFRDMTRIAAGSPSIWPDILASNRDAVLAALDAYLDALTDVRGLVAGADREGLLGLLERARAARRNLPVGVDPDEPLVVLRVPVPDRPGVLREVTTLAGTLGVNVVDLEIAHSLEGGAGVMVLVVPSAGAVPLEGALVEAGYHVAKTVLQ